MNSVLPVKSKYIPKKKSRLMSKHTRVVTVEYIVQDCPICGKIIVKHHLYPTDDKDKKKQMK